MSISTLISKFKKLFIRKVRMPYKVFVNPDGKIIYEDKKYIGIVIGLIDHKEMFPDENLNYMDTDKETAHILYQSNHITEKKNLK
ncbi:MAG: hypothetical protein ACT4ON_13575 [Bacteroidota bacterium]